MAVAEASFKISIDSTSFGFISAIEPATIGIPSITYNGSLSAVIERLPRIRTSPNSPGRLFVVISTPGALPCIACKAFCTGRSFICFSETFVNAPVTSLFLTTP